MPSSRSDSEPLSIETALAVSLRLSYCGPMPSPFEPRELSARKSPAKAQSESASHFGNSHPFSATPSSIPRRRIAILTFIFLNCFYLLTSSGRVRVSDEVMTLFQDQSLAAHASTAVPQAVRYGLFYGRFDRNGGPQSPYPPGQALAALPWYFAARVLTESRAVPADAHDVVLGGVVAFSSATYAAISGALILLIFFQLGCGLRPAALFTAAIAFSTPLFAYSAWFYSEPLTTMLLLGATLAFLKVRESQGGFNLAVLIGSLCLSASTWVRPTNLIACIAFLVALGMDAWGRVSHDGRGSRLHKTSLHPATKTMLTATTALGISGALYLVRNTVLFGSPLDFGYPVVAEGGKRLNSFETPILRGLYGLLLSPGKSIFLYAPLFLFALISIPAMWRRSRFIATLAALLPAATLIFYARYSQWEGGYAYGPRYIVPALVVACMAIGIPEHLRAGWRAVLLWTLCGIGLFVQLAGIAVSFLEAEVGRGYYNAGWTYRLSYFSLGEHLRLVAHYAGTADAAPLGLGFDRWFLTWLKAGVTPGSIATLLIAMIAGLLLSGVGLVHEMTRDAQRLVSVALEPAART